MFFVPSFLTICSLAGREKVYMYVDLPAVDAPGQTVKGKETEIDWWEWGWMEPGCVCRVKGSILLSIEKLFQYIYIQYIYRALFSNRFMIQTLIFQLSGGATQKERQSRACGEEGIFHPPCYLLRSNLQRPEDMGVPSCEQLLENQNRWCRFCSVFKGSLSRGRHYILFSCFLGPSNKIPLKRE